MARQGECIYGSGSGPFILDGLGFVDAQLRDLVDS